MDFRFEDDIILENEQVLLRPIINEDKNNLLAVAIQDASLLQYSPKQVYSKELLAAYIDNALAERIQKTRYSFSIFSKTKNAYAGSTAFLNIANSDDRLEIGATWLGPDFQGSGLNRQCKFLLLQYSFNELKANRVEFRTDERNLASRRAIEKIGASLEGILREHMLVQSGIRRNTVYYSILQKEWDNMQANFLSY